MSQGWQVCVCVYCAKLRASLASLQVVIVFFGGSPVTPRVGGEGGSYHPGSTQEVPEWIR